MKSSKSLAIAGLVCGGISLFMAWFAYANIVAVILGIVGLVLAISASKKAKAGGGAKGLATAALIVSIVGLALSVIGFFSCTVCTCIAGGVDKIIEEANSLVVD